MIIPASRQTNNILLIVLLVISCNNQPAKKSAAPLTIYKAERVQNLSDSALLDLVQRQTLKYFWDFAHPVSGRAPGSDGDRTSGCGLQITSYADSWVKEVCAFSSGSSWCGKRSVAGLHVDAGMTSIPSYPARSLRP